MERCLERSPSLFLQSPAQEQPPRPHIKPLSPHRMTSSWPRPPFTMRQCQTNTLVTPTHAPCHPPKTTSTCGTTGTLQPLTTGRTNTFRPLQAATLVDSRHTHPSLNGTAPSHRN